MSRTDDPEIPNEPVHQPYYQDDFCTIYHGDSRDLIPRSNADIVVTDPPYGTKHYTSDQSVASDIWEYIFAYPVCAIFGWPEALVALCVERQVVPTEWITWWPTNAACRSFAPKGLLRESECIAIFGPGNWETLRRSRSSFSAKVLEGNYQGARPGLSNGVSSKERRVGDVWVDAAPGLAFNAKYRLHPNEKSLTILHRLVAGLTDLGDIVLDPFMGSGTTLRAAKDLGRKAIGIEIEERYCEIAARRLSQEVLDLSGP